MLPKGVTDANDASDASPAEIHLNTTHTLYFWNILNILT